MSLPSRIEARRVCGLGVMLLLAPPILGIFASSSTASSSTANPVQSALSAALNGTQASAVVLDLSSGAPIASVGVARRASPGSTLKPLLLQYALDHHIVSPDTQVFCHRNLHVGSRSLPCTHPGDQLSFNAESALAESCNTYFADLARRFSSRALETALLRSRLSHQVLDNASPEQRELTVLGLEGVTVSPLELARAYRSLLLAMPADGPVARGLDDSVRYGMANAASVPGVTILGKTGTASNPGESWTHGWFAGALPGKLVLVVLVPHGDGGTAALLGRGFFSNSRASRPQLGVPGKSSTPQRPSLLGHSLPNEASRVG